MGWTMDANQSHHVNWREEVLYFVFGDGKYPEPEQVFFFPPALLKIESKAKKSIQLEPEPALAGDVRGRRGISRSSGNPASQDGRQQGKPGRTGSGLRVTAAVQRTSAHSRLECAAGCNTHSSWLEVGHSP